MSYQSINRATTLAPQSTEAALEKLLAQVEKAIFDRSDPILAELSIVVFVFVTLLLIVYFPAITMWLPSLLH